MTRYANQPGFGLYDTLVRDRATGRVRVERRWMKERQALNLNATPVTAPTWDSTGWLPNGTHRKTGTPLNPDGVPVEYDQAVRGGDASLMTDAALAEAYRARVPASEARASAERHAAHLRADAERVAELQARPHAGPSAAMGGMPLSVAFAREAAAERPDDGTVLKEVPVIRGGVIRMENRRVRYTDRDDAQKPLGDQRRDSRWGRSKRPVTAADLVQPEDQNSVRLPYGWQEMRKVIKRMGGTWQPITKSWRLPDAAKAADIRRVLEERAVREGVI